MEAPRHPLDVGLDRSTQCLDSRLTKVGMVRGDARVNSDKWMPSHYPTSWNGPIQYVWQHRLLTASPHTMWWRFSDMEVDAYATRCHHPYGPRHTPEEWTLRPDFHFWPPPKQAALLWTLTHLVEYQTQSKAIIPTGLYRRPPPGQMESLSTSSQSVRSRKLSGDTLAHPHRAPVSPLKEWADVE